MEQHGLSHPVFSPFPVPADDHCAAAGSSTAHVEAVLKEEGEEKEVSSFIHCHFVETSQRMR